MSYQTGLYKLNKRLKIGKLEIGDLPETLSFDDISTIMALGQEICFKDTNIKENKERILGLLNTKYNEYPTIAVALSINSNEKNLNDFNDAGALTIQKIPLNVYIPSDDRRNSYWIHEVCRSKRNIDKIPAERGSPVTEVMNMAIEYVRNLGEAKIYLLVEKNPEHGNGEFLLRYYNEKYGFDIIEEDVTYWYMAKELRVAGKIKTRRNKRKNRKSRKSRKSRK